MDLTGDYYLLRWRFDFTSGASRFGMWSQPGDVEKSGAWRQTKVGLFVARAMIEGKHFIKRTTHVLAECSGEDYCTFQWMALAHLAPLGLRGSVTPLTRLNGLSLVTREEIIEVTTDGRVNRMPRPDAHKRVGFATYGK